MEPEARRQEKDLTGHEAERRMADQGLACCEGEDDERGDTDPTGATRGYYVRVDAMEWQPSCD